MACLLFADTAGDRNDHASIRVAAWQSTLNGVDGFDGLAELLGGISPSAKRFLERGGPFRISNETASEVNQDLMSPAAAPVLKGKMGDRRRSIHRVGNYGRRPSTRRNCRPHQNERSTVTGRLDPALGAAQASTPPCGAVWLTTEATGSSDFPVPLLIAT